MHGGWWRAGLAPGPRSLTRRRRAGRKRSWRPKSREGSPSAGCCSGRCGGASGQGAQPLSAAHGSGSRASAWNEAAAGLIESLRGLLGVVAGQGPAAVQHAPPASPQLTAARAWGRSRLSPSRAGADLRSTQRHAQRSRPARLAGRRAPCSGSSTAFAGPLHRRCSLLTTQCPLVVQVELLKLREAAVPAPAGR